MNYKCAWIELKSMIEKDIADLEALKSKGIEKDSKDRLYSKQDGLKVVKEFIRQAESNKNKNEKEELLKIVEGEIDGLRLGKEDFRKQIDIYAEGIDFFKNQVWVVIPSGFALLGATLWIFEKVVKLNGGSEFAWRTVTSFTIGFIALLVIILIFVFYVRIKKSREFIKLISKKCGHIDIDNDIPHMNEYAFFRWKRILNFLDKIAQYKPLIEVIFSFLILIAAILLIIYVCIVPLS